MSQGWEDDVPFPKVRYVSSLEGKHLKSTKNTPEFIFSTKISPFPNHKPGNAMTQLPALSMVVLEDVDALFTNHREADQNNSSLHLDTPVLTAGKQLPPPKGNLTPPLK